MIARSLYIAISLIVLINVSISCTSLAQSQQSQVLIVGGGASGVMAGIQSARQGVETTILEPTPWLGGMLTAAGVSAIDGNHDLPSGLWGEFRQKLYDHYGGPKSVATGWVSHTLFEPSVGNDILKSMADIPNLEIHYEAAFQDVQKLDNGWVVTYKDRKGRKKQIKPTVLIDATELGDVLAKAGVQYDIGMDDRSVEKYAPVQSNDIIQDLTYVAVLKDYGKGADKTINEPEDYDPAEFECACRTEDNNIDVVDCETMLDYGKLPNDKYMINWPICGNDIYLNIIEEDAETRDQMLEEAKAQTLRFVYYIQHELGFKNLGLAEDEFDTKDDLPYIAYHRESRRIHGKALLTVHHLEEPYNQSEKYYRTGIAVGDYPIDHHHEKNPEAPEIEFIEIKVPSYNIPMGSLIPERVEGLIVAEKSIGVTNIVNGTTRLQPVVIGIGQAAGAIAALSVLEDTKPSELSIRDVQHELIKADAYVMPFIDVKPDHQYFEAIQRIGATGILKGAGVPYKWANQTWFYPDDEISEYNLVKGLETYYEESVAQIAASGKKTTALFMIGTIAQILVEDDDHVVNRWPKSKLGFEYQEDRVLKRGEVAAILDEYLAPFSLPVNYDGHLVK